MTNADRHAPHDQDKPIAPQHQAPAERSFDTWSAQAQQQEKATMSDPSAGDAHTEPSAVARGGGAARRLAPYGIVIAVFLALLAAGFVSVLGACVGGLVFCGLVRFAPHLIVPVSVPAAQPSGAGPFAASPEPGRPAAEAALGLDVSDGVADNLPGESTALRPDDETSAAREVSFLSRALELAVAQFPDPVILLDAEGRVLTANEASKSYARDATRNRHISSVIRTPSVLEAVRAVLNGAEARQVEYALLVPVERHLQASIIPLHMPAPGVEPDADSGAGVSAMMLVLHDLTSVKRAEQLRVDFVANASHEMRTPLASLNGFIQTLRGHARDDEQVREKFLTIMEDQTERMRRLIDDLLSLSRIELNEHLVPRSRVDLSLVAHDVADALAPLARERNQSLVLSWHGRIIPDKDHLRAAVVIGDRDELVQVIQNLVDNAIKYGKDGGHVRIDLGTGTPEAALDASAASANSEDTSSAIIGMSSEHMSDDAESADRPVDREIIPDPAPANHYYVSIQDDGIGIPREHLPRLTERFYRVDANMSRKIGGTGLGLAIVKHIVNRHRGWMSIDSRTGVGSTFTVFLPQASAVDQRPGASSLPSVVAFTVADPNSHAAE